MFVFSVRRHSARHKDGFCMPMENMDTDLEKDRQHRAPTVSAVTSNIVVRSHYVCTYDTVQDVVPFSTVLGRKESNSMRRHAQDMNKCLGIGRACSNSHRDDQKLTKMF